MKVNHNQSSMIFVIYNFSYEILNVLIISDDEGDRHEYLPTIPSLLGNSINGSIILIFYESLSKPSNSR